MFTGILKTDGGAHPPEKWAALTASMIAPIDMSKDSAIQAMKLQAAIADVLLPHHTEHAHEERAALATDHDRYHANHDPMARAEAALEQIVALCLATDLPVKEKTSDPEWRRVVLATIANHLADNADIERRYHARRNPSPKAAAFLAAREGA